MGGGCSSCGPVPESGKGSYDLQGSQVNGGNLATGEDKSIRTMEQKSEPFVLSQSSGTASEGIVSQSQCEVNVNASSSDVLDEGKTRTGINEEETRLKSTPAHTTADKQRNEEITKQEQIAEEDFKPGHVTAKKQTAEHAKTSGNDQLLDVLNEASDEEIQAVVAKCWDDIKQTCKRHHDNKSPQTTDPTQGWRVVRMFVSSTFADYHAEREVLVKKVCC